MGTGVYTDKVRQQMRGPHDANQFCQLVSDLHLVGLNTWNSSSGPTFQITLGRSSRIDFIFTRLMYADNRAKHAGYLENAPFLQGGPRHTPLLVGLHHKIFRPTRQHAHIFPVQLKTQCIMAFLEDALTWQCCRNQIKYTLRNTKVADLETVTSIVSASILHAYKSSGSKHVGGMSILQQRWAHFRQARLSRLLQ